MVNYGFASAILAFTAAAATAAPQPTYWPTYWPTYSPTDVHDIKHERDSHEASSGGNPNYEQTSSPTETSKERPGLVDSSPTPGPTPLPTQKPTAAAPGPSPALAASCNAVSPARFCACRYLLCFAPPSCTVSGPTQGL